MSRPPKWRTILLLAAAELLAMAVWFSATAVAPALARDWQLSDGGLAWLTMAVQIGFVAGALLSALLNLADRMPAARLMAVSSLLAGLSTALIPLTNDGSWALVLRLLTGALLAGVYPVGMKILATWTREDRGLGIGLLVGALTLGSASPHLLNAFGGVRAWQPVMFGAALAAVAGGLLALLFVDEGPYRVQTPPFNWRLASEIMRKREIMLANLGYLGHMWELYAMWAWMPAFLLASFAAAGVAASWAAATAFAVIGVGGLGSLLAGQWADRFGRTTITIASLVLSGLLSLSVGLFFGGSPLLVAALALLWGFAIVADSAQFSACVSELCPPAATGTALTVQTSMGFLLTLASIRLTPLMVQTLSWRWAFGFLALGPLVGIWAMLRLRRHPAAVQMAGGRR